MGALHLPSDHGYIVREIVAREYVVRGPGRGVLRGNVTGADRALQIEHGNVSGGDGQSAVSVGQVANRVVRLEDNPLFLGAEV